MSIHENGSQRCGITGAQFEQQVRLAFDTWSAVNCGTGHPSFIARTYPKSVCDEVGYRTDGPNRNLWIFRDDHWFDDEALDGALALTTLSVMKQTGEIYDADVELNSHQYDFTLGETNVGTDLFSVVLHEAGHVLGIGHSPWSTSTMDDAYATGTLEARTLEADDINAICDIMPPGSSAAECDAEPRNGFDAHCDLPDSGCCSLTVGRRSNARLPRMALMCSLLMLWRRRRIRSR